MPTNLLDFKKIRSQVATGSYLLVCGKDPGGGGDSHLPYKKNKGACWKF